MFQVTLSDNQHQQRLDEERYIGLIEPLDMPYALFINMDILIKRVNGDLIDVPFFAYIYGVGKSKMNPTDGSIPSVPIIVWGVYSTEGKIEYANQCRYQTKFLSKVVESLTNSGYKNIGAMVMDRISVRIREFLGIKAGETDYKTQMVAASGVFGSSSMDSPKYIFTQEIYSDVKKYFALIDGKIAATEDQMRQYSDRMDIILKDGFGVDIAELEEQIQLEEYYQLLRDDLIKYERVTNMNYNPHKNRMDGDLLPTINIINEAFSKDVAVHRPHRQQGVEMCPAYDECMNGLLSDYCAIYHPKIFEESNILI